LRKPAVTNWVFLRGLTREAGHWGRFPAVFGALVAGSRIATPDLPGSGRRHRQRSPAHVAGMVESVRTDLTAAGIPPPYRVLGLSLGGLVAIEWAVRYPEEVAGCVLINTSLRPLSPFFERLRPRQYPRLLRVLLGSGGAEDKESLILAMTSRLVAKPAEVLAAWSACRRERPVSRRNALLQLIAAGRYRAPRRPPAIPMLVLAAARDALVNPACSARLAAAWSLPLAVHPAAGHDLPLDDPEWVAGQVRAWLPRLAGESRQSAADSIYPTALGT
jgi:pimeloyl-ACP methyl ester carboxylesterase